MKLKNATVALQALNEFKHFRNVALTKESSLEKQKVVPIMLLQYQKTLIMLTYDHLKNVKKKRLKIGTLSVSLKLRLVIRDKNSSNFSCQVRYV